MSDKNQNEFLKNLVSTEIGGKFAAIHAYDKMMWIVRSGYLTLVFAGWSFLVKAAVENKTRFTEIFEYILIMSAFSLTLAVGGFLIDRNYARRKFRVIHSLDRLMQVAGTTNWEDPDVLPKGLLLEELKISGDVDDKKYESRAFLNEMTVSYIIYMAPSIMIFTILIVMIFQL